MIRVFTFTEQETSQLAELLTDCRGVAYYEKLVSDFFSQLESGIDTRHPLPATVRAGRVGETTEELTHEDAS